MGWKYSFEKDNVNYPIIKYVVTVSPNQDICDRMRNLRVNDVWYIYKVRAKCYRL